MQLLIDHGADRNALKPQIHALHEAVYKGDEDVVQTLLRLKVNPDLAFPNHITPLYIASYKGHINIVESLLDAGAKVYRIDERRERYSPLAVALYRGYIDVVQLLLYAKANVNHETKSGWTPLCAASYIGSIESVEFLLDHGANIHHAIKVDVDTDIKKGDMPLQIAQKKGHIDIVKFLQGRLQHDAMQKEGSKK